MRGTAAERQPRHGPVEDWLDRLTTLTNEGGTRKWAIVNAQLIDVAPDGFIGVGGVLIEGGRIAGCGPSVNRDSIGDVPVVDLGHKYVLPGLVDTHVHLSWDASADPVRRLLAELDQPDQLRRRIEQNALTALSKGTTTVRDLGGPNDAILGLRDSILAGTSHGPRILAAGAVITTPIGHCYYVGRVATGPRQAASAAAQQVSIGADVIKIMVTGGVHTPGSDPGRLQFDSRAIRAVVEVAHMAGRRVTAHATSSRAVRSAIAAGVDSIQHGARMDAWTIDQMIQRGNRLTPTLSTGKTIEVHRDDERIPDHVRQRTRMRNSTGERVSGFQRAYRAGVPIAAGTDAGTTFVGHGSLPLELRWLREAGMSPRASIAAATFIAARELGLADRIGSLSVGSEADLLVTNSDPLDEPDALDYLGAVIQRGRLVANREGLVIGAQE